MKVRNLVVLFVKRSPHYFVQFRSLKKHFFHKSFGLTIETIETVFCQLFGQLLDHLAPFRKVKIHSYIFILVSLTPNYNIPLHPLPSSSPPPPQKNILAKVLYSSLLVMDHLQQNVGKQLSHARSLTFVSNFKWLTWHKKNNASI